MNQYTATVLAKGQVVVPKEIRDGLGIEVGDSLSCFVRGSAVILKKKIQTTTYASSEVEGDHFPMGVDGEGKTVAISINDLKGITCLLGKHGMGKSVHALNMMINMYTSGKSIIVFDPYGDRIAEMKNYIEDLGDESIYHFVVDETSDWTSLKKEIEKNKKQKVIAINTNFQGIGSKRSAELTKPIILDCYKELVDTNTAIFLDEFGNYYDEQMWSTICKSGGYTCILDQGRDTLSKSQVKAIFDHINQIAIYQVRGLTAKYLVEDLGISHTVQDLKSIEKYHFYFHSTVGNKDGGKLLTGIYPFS